MFGRTIGVAKGRNSPLQWAGAGEEVSDKQHRAAIPGIKYPQKPRIVFFSAKASKTSPQEQIFCGTDLMGAPVIKLSILSFPVYITKTNVKSVIDSAVLH